MTRKHIHFFLIQLFHTNVPMTNIKNLLPEYTYISIRVQINIRVLYT